MSVNFKDNRIEVVAALDDAAIAFLYEAAGELQPSVKRNTAVKTGQLKNSWDYVVDESKKEATIVSPLQNAIWEEFGTGEHSIKGGGRKGYWVFVDTGGKPQAPKGGKTYTKEEAKKVVAIMRKKGLNAYYTNGKTANRPLYKAFTVSEEVIPLNSNTNSLSDGVFFMTFAMLSEPRITLYPVLLFSNVIVCR